MQKNQNFKNSVLNWIIMVLILLILPGSKNMETVDRMEKEFGRLHWIENRGQFPASVNYMLQIPDGRIFLQENGRITYQIRGEKQNWTIDEFIETNYRWQPKGSVKMPGKVHYLKGPIANHRKNVSNYLKVELGELWPGISMELNSSHDVLEKLIRLEPGATIADFSVRIAGAEDICINDEEQLQLDLQEESLYFSRPIAWQKKAGADIPVDIKYTLDPVNGSYGFSVWNYDDSRVLYIDPVLSSGFIGGSAWDFCRRVATGKNGKVYFGGVTESVDFPATPNTMDPVYNDTTDSIRVCSSWRHALLSVAKIRNYYMIW